MNVLKHISVAALLLTSTAAYAEYPEKQINVIIPFGPGSNTDTIGRLFLNAMSSALGGATIVPTNVAGAGGTIGTAQLASAPNDGYTLGFNPIATVTIQPHLRPLPYGGDSFEPICRLADTPVAVQVAPDSPYETLEDLIAAAADGEVVATGPAPGSLPHIAQAALAAANDVEFTYLPSGGGSAAATAVLGGDAAISVQLVSNAETFGLKSLAVMADERSSVDPDVPTLKELGTDLSLSVWFGAFAPAGTPEDVLEALSAACETAVSDQALIDGMDAANILISYQGRSEFSDFYETQFNENQGLLELIGISQ